MANIPTAEQTVFPEQGGLPNANPAAFGAPVATAQGQIGQGLGQAGDIAGQRALAIQGLKNEATANDADVSFQTDLGKIEDQFYSLRGREAAEAYPKFQSDVQALRKQYLGSMTNPMTANMLDQSLSYTMSRSMRQGGIFAGEQTRQWVSSSQLAKVGLLQDQIARHFNDDAYYATAKQGIRDGMKAAGETEGWSPEETQLRTDAELAKAQKNREDAALAALKGLPLDQQAAALAHAPAVYEDNIIQGESKGDIKAVNKSTGAAGLYQFIPSTAAQYGLSKADLTNPDPKIQQKVHDAFVQFTEDNRKALMQGLGREPTNAELALAHQQGAAGALKLLQNPNALATDIVGKDAVIGNGGAANMSASQFADGVMNYYHMNGPTGLAGNDPSNWAAQLPPDKRQALAKSIIDESHAQQSQSETEQRFAAWKAQEQVKTAEMGYKQQMIAHSADPRQPPADLVAASKDPALASDPEAISRLVSFQNTLNRKPVDDTANASAANDIFRRMQPGYQGADKITSADQITEAFAPPDGSQGSINQKGYTFLMKEWDNQRTPDGQKLSTVQGKFLAGVKTQITGSNAFGMSFPPEDAQYFAFTQAVADKVNEWRTQGKDVSKLFDPTPGNADYLGRPGFIHQYQTSLQQRMQHQMDAMTDTGAGGTTSTDSGDANATGAIVPNDPKDITTYTTRDKLQAAIDARIIPWDKDTLDYIKLRGWKTVE